MVLCLHRNARSFSFLVALLIATIAPSIFAAPFGPQSIIVVTSDGTGMASTSFNAQVNLREYAISVTGGTPSASLVQSIPLSTTVTSSGNRALTVQQSAAVEGRLGLSQDGQYLMLGGYNSGTNVLNSGGQTADRVIARVDLAGNVDTTTAIPVAQFPSNSSPRSIASLDGSNFWIDTSGAGVRYGPYQTTTLTQLVGTNGRVVSIYKNQLYITAQTTAAAPNGPLQGVGKVGTGTPTTAGQTTTALPGFTASTTTPSPNPSAYDFFFADDNTLYVADDNSSANGGGVQKWIFNGSNWVKQFTMATLGMRGLTGSVDPSTGNVVLFSTQTFNANGGNQLFAFTDTLTNTLLANTTQFLLDTAPANVTFRGIQFVPEPGSIIALCGAALAIRRRRNKR